MKQTFFLSLRFAVMMLCFGLLISSCGSSRKTQTNHLYFQTGRDTVGVAQKEILIRPNDLLSIQVYSKGQNQDQAKVFNLPENVATQGYQVNAAGNIILPLIGTVKAAGITRTQLQDVITDKLATYVKDPAVAVQFSGFSVNILGEVKSPGVQRFTSDRVTIIDAITGAGDLTDFGRRDIVRIIREENGRRVYHSIDLRSKTLFSSPVYLLQPNDIVYVEANQNKLKQLNVDPEKQRRSALFFTITSFVFTIASLAITFLR